MSQTWTGQDEPDPIIIGPAGWVRVILRGLVLGVLTFGCLALLLLFVCRSAFLILGMRLIMRGELMKERGAVVANHSSWLDIFALNARKRIYFVSKSEVAKWPGIGWLARATGTVFINRNPREAAAQTEVFRNRLLAGHKLLFFPEGTSTDGLRVLPFKSTLFAAFFSDELRHEMHIQPVTVIYHAPQGEEDRFYGWWGDMEFGPHLLKTLAARRQGSVELVYHAPVRVDDFPNRKTLAAHVEQVVRKGHHLALG
ncbi:1-acyl-sn-glycerol-3-phosphate acyltransferase [Nymphon striatum]|nr:1-acyl-sn-glycerol-3-phosphate acyltransferase [Nymphon striatum]